MFACQEQKSLVHSEFDACKFYHRTGKLSIPFLDGVVRQYAGLSQFLYSHSFVKVNSSSEY